MSHRRYKVLLDLYNECNEDFWLISQESRDLFFDILFNRAQPEG